MEPNGRVLMSAVGRGDLELIRRFLDQGADPNASVESSGNAMSAAFRRTDPDVLALLASYGGVVPEHSDMSTLDTSSLRAIYQDALPLRYYVDVQDIEVLSDRFNEDAGAVREAIALTLRGNDLMKLDVLRLCLERDPDAAKTMHANKLIGLLH